MLPLVSKRWANIMRTSTEVWRQACLDLSQILPDTSDGQRRSLDSAAMVEWFQARLGRFRHLGLGRTRGSLKLRLAVTSMLLSTQAASLTKLSLDMGPCGLRGTDLCILAAIRGLEALDVHVNGSGLDDHGATLIRIASRLPDLYQLDVNNEAEQNADPSPGETKLLRCQELAELRSTTLTSLSIAIASGTGDVLRLSGAPNLEKCHLLAYQRSSAEFQVDPTTFAGCSWLEELTLHHVRNLSLQTGCFRALPALSSLTLTDCSLQAVPLALAPLTALSVLNLSFNEQLSIDDLGLHTLRTMKKLRLLDLAKREPAVHAACSVQALLCLVKAFASDRPCLDVNIDPKLCQTYEPETGHWGVSD